MFYIIKRKCTFSNLFAYYTLPALNTKEGNKKEMYEIKFSKRIDGKYADREGKKFNFVLILHNVRIVKINPYFDCVETLTLLIVLVNTT